jgi:hypothetical protein
MPYAVRKVRGKELYYVVNKTTGKKYSKDPLSKTMAERQLKALHIHVKK